MGKSSPMATVERIIIKQTPRIGNIELPQQITSKRPPRLSWLKGPTHHALTLHTSRRRPQRILNGSSPTHRCLLSDKSRAQYRSRTKRMPESGNKWTTLWHKNKHQNPKNVLINSTLAPVLLPSKRPQKLLCHANHHILRCTSTREIVFEERPRAMRRRRRRGAWISRGATHAAS